MTDEQKLEAQVPASVPDKPARKPRAPKMAAPAKPHGKKTLAAALVAVVLAAADLFMTIRFGIKVF